jgi:hypothetical protein
MKVGDRVRITGRDHPWSGSTGRIVGTFDHHALDWTVELDGGDYPGHRVAASTADLAAALPVAEEDTPA